ncbi:MAG: type II secretion system protein [Planctomycetota bacterium]
MVAPKMTPTLKVGISMNSSNITTKSVPIGAMSVGAAAFTLVEIILALAIASISVLALLRLHLVSIGLAETAQITSHAVFLAEQKIAEKLAPGYPDVGTDTGTVENNGLSLNWQTEVTDLQLPRFDDTDVTGLRKISVDVSYKHGLGRKRLQMSTYVADRKLP